MKLRLLILTILFGVGSASYGQDYYSIKHHKEHAIVEKISLGFGIGNEYARNGLLFSYYPSQYFGISMAYGISKIGRKSRRDFMNYFIHDWTHATSFSAKFRFIRKNAKNYFRPYFQASWGTIGTEYSNRYTIGFEHSNILAPSLALGADLTLNNRKGLLLSASLAKTYPDAKYQIEEGPLNLSLGIKCILR